MIWVYFRFTFGGPKVWFRPKPKVHRKSNFGQNRNRNFGFFLETLFGVYIPPHLIEHLGNPQSFSTMQCNSDPISDEPYRGPFNTRGATNIPLVVVMIIVATAFLVVILIFAKKFFSLFCKSANLPRSNSNSELRRTARRGRGATVSASSVTPPEPSEDRLLHQGPSNTEVPESYPSAPPSYEEVIKDNPGVLSRGVPSAPPPYSESLTMTQV